MYCISVVIYRTKNNLGTAGLLSVVHESIGDNNSSWLTKTEPAPKADILGFLTFSITSMSCMYINPNPHYTCQSIQLTTLKLNGCFR
jgi:hypothetical protein